MNFLQKLKNQINPFDGGKTFNNPQPGRAMAVGRDRAPIPGQAQVPYSQATADRYNANPQQFAGRNAIDPKYFGYPEDRGQYQEDDGLVLSGGQLRPLSSLNPGEPWINPQNGYSPQVDTPLDRIRRLFGY